ncbi:MAG: aspartate aminotransferase family protein [Deltaproteobacteria bacterium]|nr:aspartate aminotransferase family protein [Deltaproteobacteria bacterium]
MRTTIPERGRSNEELLQALRELRSSDTNWREGRVFSLVYFGGDRHEELLESAHALFAPTNALNPIAFPSLRRMEAEVVEMAADLFHGPSSAVGTMTSGGTESIFLAVATYRDKARKERPWVLRPEIVAPSTVHPAFDKAGHYLGVSIRRVPVGVDFRADVSRMGRAVGPRTIAIVGSAPQYPHGLVDPIEALSTLARRKGLPLHVDACVGGFVLPWLERLGRNIDRWDFRVEGVSSISADLHKYGYAAKGASLLIWRDMDFMRHQFYVATEWPGGIYASATAAGTRPGGPIAAAWAGLRGFGEDGYLAAARQSLNAADRLRAGVRAIPGLRLIGDSVATIVTWGAAANGPDVFAVADALERRGWSVDRQQRPACVHLTVTRNHVEAADSYLADLRASVEEVRANPALARSGTAPMYGMMAKVPIRGLVKSSVKKVMEAMYAPGAKSADVNAAKGDGLIDRMIDRHGESIEQALDRVERLRKRLGFGG